MTKRTAGLLAGLAILGIALLTIDYTHTRAIVYALIWAAVATLLAWNDRRTRNRTPRA